MTFIDPHWSTGEDADNEASPAPSTRSALRQALPAARRPAALTGILVVFLAGFALIQGFPSLEGQTPVTQPPTETVMETTDTDLTIHIGPTGVDPAHLQVHPGDTITWINDENTPHILESKDLLNTVGKPLNSPALFSGMTYEFTVQANHPTGVFLYESATSADVKGEIEVLQDAEPVAQPATEEHTDVPVDTPLTSVTPPTETPPPPPVETTVASSASSSTASVASQTSVEKLIGYNPYTIDSTQQHPFDASGNPVKTTSRVVTPIHSAAPRNPETGASVWGIVGGSIAILFWMSRKYVLTI